MEEDVNPEYEYLKDGVLTPEQVDDILLENFIGPNNN